ncbi:hypothetical protein NEOLI_000298 [Neolecta irregularis DAH-3]|uniref:DUF7330 domain-containing protein n=1 Tax=Neolecta irregularis (strain DAH-3) TaxID=1198029 RepID=A0A1U7LUE7_NEOID|nr:hypothetical protein NEOLI_000298 [Neolecta irregularis DAH-3]|eukprot:OLL26249.1 hypothetical protein NEOLI_000298 [Neolecta irregularis DAH-3]
MEHVRCVLSTVLNGKAMNKEYIPGNSYDGNQLFVVKGGRIAVKGQYDITNRRGIQIEHRGNVNVIEADVDNVEVEFSISQVWKKHCSITTITSIRIPKGKILDAVDIDLPIFDILFDDVNAEIKELGIRAAEGDVAFDSKNLETDHIGIDVNVGTIRGNYKTSRLSASTRVGDIDLNLEVFGKDAEIKTSVATGSSHLHVSKSHDTRNIKSKHVAYNGSITLYYPKTWEGKVRAQTNVGRVSFSDQIQVTKQKSDVVKDDKEGLKGNGQSLLHVQTDVGEIVVDLE